MVKKLCFCMFMIICLGILPTIASSEDKILIIRDMNGKEHSFSLADLQRLEVHTATYTYYDENEEKVEKEFTGVLVRSLLDAVYAGDESLILTFSDVSGQETVMHQSFLKMKYLNLNQLEPILTWDMNGGLGLVVPQTDIPNKVSRAEDIISITLAPSSIKDPWFGESGAYSSGLVDINSNDFDFVFVKYIYERGIAVGSFTNTFDTNRWLTRAQFITYLGRLAGVNINNQTDRSEMPFMDIAIIAYDYARPYICWAKENGILTGATDTSFRPSDPVTREQMSVMLYRFAKLYDINLEQGHADMVDSADISSYAREAVSKLCGNYMPLFADGSFRPQEFATRSQMARAFYYILQAREFDHSCNPPFEQSTDIDWDTFYHTEEVHITILDPDGKPVPNLCINIEHEFGKFGSYTPGDAITQTTRTARREVSPGATYTVTVTDRKMLDYDRTKQRNQMFFSFYYGDKEMGNEFTFVWNKPTPRELDLATPHKVTIVFQDKAGNPVENLWVTMYDINSKDLWAPRQVSLGFTDNEGSVYWTFPEISAFSGGALYNMERSDSRTYLSGGDFTIDVKEGNETFYVEWAPSWIMLKILDIDGEPAAGQSISVTRAEGPKDHLLIVATTDLDGTVLWDDVEAGDYLLNVYKNGSINDENIIQTIGFQVKNMNKNIVITLK